MNEHIFTIEEIKNFENREEFEERIKTLGARK